MRGVRGCGAGAAAWASRMQRALLPAAAALGMSKATGRNNLRATAQPQTSLAALGATAATSCSPGSSKPLWTLGWPKGQIPEAAQTLETGIWRGGRDTWQPREGLVCQLQVSPAGAFTQNP